MRIFFMCLAVAVLCGMPLGAAAQTQLPAANVVFSDSEDLQTKLNQGDLGGTSLAAEPILTSASSANLSNETVISSLTQLNALIGSGLVTGAHTVDTTLSQEQVEDFVDGVLVAGSNITLTYDDAAGTLTIASTGGGGGTTNLGTTVASGDFTVTSSTGSNAVVPAATTTTAGALTAADKTKLDGIATGATAFTPAAAVATNHSGYIAGHTDGTDCGSGLAARGTDASGNATGCFAPVAGSSLRGLAFPISRDDWSSGDCFILTDGDVQGIATQCDEAVTDYRPPTAATVTAIRFVASADAVSGNVCDVAFRLLGTSDAPGAGAVAGTLTIGNSNSDQRGETAVASFSSASVIGSGWQISITANGSSSCSSIRGTISLEYTV